MCAMVLIQSWRAHIVRDSFKYVTNHIVRDSFLCVSYSTQYEYDHTKSSRVIDLKKIFACIVRDSFKYVTNHVVRDWLCRDAYHLRWLFMCVMQWSSFNYVVNQLVREYVVNHMVCKSFRNHTVRESLWFDANHLRRLFMCVTWFTHLDGFLTRPYVWRDKIICLQWYFSNVWQDSICFGRTRIE